MRFAFQLSKMERTQANRIKMAGATWGHLKLRRRIETDNVMKKTTEGDKEVPTK